MLSGEAPSGEQKRLPEWLRREIGKGDNVRAVKRLLRGKRLNTVCEEARCPNLGECFEKGTATFLLLGEFCTRNCSFCSVNGGNPLQPDTKEPARIAEAAESMGLSYVVLTSVTRDDLADGGAAHFARTIVAIKKSNSGARVEVLTPDFGGNLEAVDTVCEAGPDLYNHNIETVPSLYKKVRPGADYNRSVKLLAHVKQNYPHLVTKSGLMLGLGEKRSEVTDVMQDLLGAGCDLLTIGQYMRPGRKHLEVVEYVSPDVFRGLEAEGKEMGFRGVYSGPLVRSSFNAETFRREVELGRVLQN